MSDLKGKMGHLGKVVEEVKTVNPESKAIAISLDVTDEAQWKACMEVC